jgi:integrase
MAAFSQLPSGKWRAQVRRAGFVRGATFTLKRDAEAWARDVERQAEHVTAGGFAPVPKGTTLADLIDRYGELHAKTPGRTKAATLAMLRRDIGHVKLAALTPLVLREFIDRRRKAGAGGVTIAADLSFLSAVLKWGRHARQLDIPERLALEARASLKHQGLNTRGNERTREPTDVELIRLYAHWSGMARLKIGRPTICKFALATGMRLGEICNLQIEDIDRDARTAIVRDRKDPRNKIGNHQTVPLLPDAWSIFEQVAGERTEGTLFPVNEKSVSTAFTRACADVQPPIVDLHFHDLRHRATAQFFRMGLDIPRVALLTGHKTWAMLRRYTDIKAADVHAIVGKPKSTRLRAVRTGAAK